MATSIKSLPGEIWKPVSGWEGFYEVSDNGRVRSVTRYVRGRPNVPRHTVRQRQMKLQMTNSGYLLVRFCKRGMKAARLVHRLVLEAFVGPCPKGMECCHNNGEKCDNRVSNLRWDTHMANVADTIAEGKQWRGERLARARLTEAQVLEIRKVYLPRDPIYGATPLARRLGVSRSTVEKAALGTRNWAWLA